MNQGIVVQIILIAAGVIMMILAIGSLAKRRMAEQICISWGIIAVVFIVAGIVLRPNGWVNMMSTAGLILIVVIGACVFGGMFVITSRLSEVIRKNNELAMQVSLLNEEMWNLKQRIIKEDLEKEQKEKAENK